MMDVTAKGEAIPSQHCQYHARETENCGGKLFVHNGDFALTKTIYQAKGGGLAGISVSLFFRTAKKVFYLVIDG